MALQAEESSKQFFESLINLDKITSKYKKKSCLDDIVLGSTSAAPYGAASLTLKLRTDQRPLPLEVPQLQILNHKPQTPNPEFQIKLISESTHAASAFICGCHQS